MELECFPVTERPPELVPGRPGRAWMDNFTARHPYRCLPLAMANTSGWELLCPMSFTAEWNGGPMQGDITLRADSPNPDFHKLASSHFSHGVLTFHAGYLFRTPPGWSMLAQGPPNHVKDGIQPLAGVVETDWLPFPFTMNWIFTRPGRVRFEKGEPFCFITLLQDKTLHDIQPVIRRMDSDPELRHQYDVWEKHRSEFNQKIFRGDPEATKAAWQRYYFKGEFPEEANAPNPEGHVNKRRLKTPKFR
ncbi:MAG: hypothetical protein JNL41_18540 [Phenylobacterium sp.]|uniref:DUF6065 family protein n=1 Tax=Phenylobacterium sp. TaxID=1871053 RepID=UPI001A3E9305|nr:DUF6065 family protein [Phenylobacterium sp.]MBL8556279.1 hypothetical protein [Phenylobacterium sp.]